MAGAFSIPVGALAAKMKTDVDLIVRKVTLDLFSEVVQRTPMRTGRARANWTCSQGAPNLTTTESVDQSRGTAEAAKAMTFKAGGVVHLGNGLPYIGKLENGSSQQAPQGMVRLAVQRMSDHIAAAVAK